jgi:uncharacterized protein (TIGR03086 family)
MTPSLELYLSALNRLRTVVDAVPADRWNAATPCPDWSARQLLGHLIDGQHQVVSMVNGDGPRPPVTEPEALASLAGPEPATAWRRTHQNTDQRLREVAPGTSVPTPLGARTVEELLGIALIEPVIHGWDLASATGQPATIESAAASALLPGVLALGTQLQATGMYRTSISVADHAPAHEQLLAALGRNPHPSQK